MNETRNEESIEKRIESWIEAGKEPAEARWQGALTAFLETVLPYVVPGKAVTLEALGPEEADLFTRICLVMDLAPYLAAIYLPPALADRFHPPVRAEALQRLADGAASHKLLVIRTGDLKRIMTVELSAGAKRPGIDILEEGAFLGGYDYETPEDCLREVSKYVWVHMGRQQWKWSAAEIDAYTRDWFARCAAAGSARLPVNPLYSYLHNPGRIGLTRVEAVFRLLEETLDGMLGDLAKDPADAGSEPPEAAVRRRVEERMLDLLNLIRKNEAVDFAAFSGQEEEAFKDGFERTVIRTVEKAAGDLSG